MYVARSATKIGARRLTPFDTNVLLWKATVSLS